ncbi:tRNA(Ile)-lysidine synthase [Methylomarinovum caldicuralii]|uniref:tRNA(Ile)-lysidine synthase n=1 Tax=Methylomarinovum caldicuralii TaxID=438856 RepID=A0AAU9CNM0_9GAMM|nr:tRNA lysidine(34) synthetase TilS [Methylomarinovum caldicuralii]BCX81117.1 tRNA(Ile)-lysidine synthase [Methylomarinovum caldicuralii]
MNELRHRLHRFLNAHPARRYWIGYSGGLDSHVLLHLCAELRAETGPVFAALHVNHRLHPDAPVWQDHCRAICESLQVPFRAVQVDATPRPGQSPEEAARKARYRAFRETLGANEALLLAQHQDDQAETVLLQLLRGAGPAGLAGMPACTDLGQGWLLRPLLDVPRQTLQAYAKAEGLHWIDDPSNTDTRYDRNFLRHRVMPLLRRRWPAADRTLARSARHCAETVALLEAATNPALDALMAADGSLDFAALTTRPEPQQRGLLRTWLKRQGTRPPSTVYLDRILSECRQAASDRIPCIRWRGGEVRRWRGRLYFLATPPPPATDWQSPWDGRAALLLPDGSRLEAVPAPRGIPLALWQERPITVRYRRGGEILRQHGHRRPLKKFLQEQRVPPWKRHHLPLVYLGEELVAVAGLWCAELTDRTPAVRPRWLPQSHDRSFEPVTD